MKYYSRDVFGNIKFQPDLNRNINSIFKNITLSIFATPITKSKSKINFSISLN